MGRRDPLRCADHGVRLPVVGNRTRTLPADDPDAHLFMWTLAWDAHAFVHQPLSIFNANIFYPNRDTLAYSAIGSAFFAAPVIWLTGNPILAANFVSLLSCALCGLGATCPGGASGSASPRRAGRDTPTCFRPTSGVDWSRG